MKLYEIKADGYYRESYIRVYVWANDEEEAFSLAEKEFDAAGFPKETPLSLKFLFDQNENSFSTKPSGAGFFMLVPKGGMNAS